MDIRRMSSVPCVRKLERALPIAYAIVGAMWIAVALLYRFFEPPSMLTPAAVAIAVVFFGLSCYAGLKKRTRPNATGDGGSNN